MTQRPFRLWGECRDNPASRRGQAVSIIGEAGLGKSRLLYAFRQALGDTDCTWLEGRCHPYGAALAYGPIVELLKQYFRIDAGDRDQDMQHKVAHGLVQLGPALQATAPYVHHLLATAVDRDLLASMAPEAVKHQIFAALRAWWVHWPAAVHWCWR